jgi:hypothetical protein
MGTKEELAPTRKWLKNRIGTKRGIGMSLARDKRWANFWVEHQIFGSLKTIGERSIERLEKRWRISPS